MVIETAPAVERASIELRKDVRWRYASSNGRDVWAAGHAFLNGEFRDAAGIAEIFLKNSASDFKAFVNLAKGMNGNFAVITKDAGSIFACADRVRSYPVFYSLKGGALTIGDDAGSMIKKLGIGSPDEDSAKEFLMSGYVTGEDTLISEIKQLQAGEALYFDLKKDRSLKDITKERYYAYLNKEKEGASLSEMADSYDEILIRVFRRLLASVDNRKIIVPLSGGVDSRLVACMLKRLKYGNVVCMTYGIKSSWERSIAENVADKLGYDWIYVECPREKWHDIYNSRDFRTFFYSYNNISSLANLNNWIALSELKSKRLIPDDAVFAPGHTGDFICGGHLHNVFGERQSGITKKDLTEGILKKHYGLWRCKLDEPEMRKYLIGRISESIAFLNINSEQDIADAYEYWEWQERQAKFIVNSVRAYDFWEYEWRIPLWDNELMDFWCKVPYKFKLNKELYVEYLSKKDGFKLFGRDPYGPRHRKRRLSPRLRKYLEYFKEPSGVYGLYGLRDYAAASFFNRGWININSLLAKDYLNNIKRELSK